MYIDHLASKDGRLLPMNHFTDCLIVLYFTVRKSIVCENVLGYLETLRLENNYSNIVFVQVSMDKTIRDWDECVKNDNWLHIPYFPIQSRTSLFKTYKVDRLPFMVVCCGNNHLVVPRHVMEELKLYNPAPFILELDYYLNLFGIHEYIVL